MALGNLEPHFIDAAIVKIKKKKKKKNLPKKMKYECPLVACFKRGHNSTKKNATTAFLNADLDAFYGRMFKTRPQVCFLSCV